MTEYSLGRDSPKIFHALRRFLSTDELDLISKDYEYAATQGGNVEVQLTREEGVSFNPRMARLLVILVHDLQVQELSVLRSVLYTAITTSNILVRETAPAVTPHALPEELALRVKLACEGGAGDDATAEMLRGVIILDTVRHLHQCHWAPDELEAVLTLARELVSALNHANLPAVLSQKLVHALEMQKRRLVTDTGELR
jgi:hypothetical protein